jgi:hypothetical protein
VQPVERKPSSPVSTDKEIGFMALEALMILVGGLLLGWVARMIEDGEAGVGGGQ